ncbi:MAG: GldG family protein [Alphaproteobacteria bacterium]|nr:GldG family protein [Alphaproteobacteria bacterium]
MKSLMLFLKQHSIWFVTILVFISWSAVNIISYYGITNAKIDLSNGQIFTLSKHSQSLLKEMKSPLTIRFFYSREAGEHNPVIQRYAKRIRSLLLDYKSHSHGQIKLEFIDPKPYSSEEDLALSHGIQGVPLDNFGTKLYLGLSVASQTDDIVAIPYLDVEKEQFLEYDISRTLYDFIHPEKKNIGIITSIPLGNFVPEGKTMRFQPWALFQQIQDLYHLTFIDPATMQHLPTDMDILLMVQPSQLPDPLLYDIDQYILKGGKTIIFDDPLIESANPKAVPHSTHGIDFLFNAWGIAIDPSMVVGDFSNATAVAQDNSAQQVTSYLPWPTLTKNNFSRDDVTISNLNRIQLASAGFIQKMANHSTIIAPLLFSTKQSMPLNVDIVRRASPKELLSHFKPSGISYTYGARILGSLSTAFPNGISNHPPKNEHGMSNTVDESASSPHVLHSVKDTHVVVIADIDLLHDRFWAQIQDMYGQRVVIPFSDNAFFILNMIDQFGGSDSLIHLRSKGNQTRPFTTIDVIKKKSEQLYLAKEKSLQQSLIILEKQLTDAATKNNNASSIITPSQGQTIEAIRFKLLETRKELRNVNHALREEIESYYFIIKWIGIGMIPSALCIIYFIIGIRKTVIRRRIH